MADVAAKVGLVGLLVVVLVDPDLANLKDKAAGARAVAYPLLSFSVPAIWYLFWRDRTPFPWLADLLITFTCFTDILGNRMNLYDTIVWFDDWMHFMNVGLLGAAVVLLTLPRSAPWWVVMERSVGFGALAAILWELAEFFAFLQFSPERRNAYVDTLGDLGLGVLGAVVAAVAIHRAWAHGMLRGTVPPLDSLAATRAHQERVDHTV